MMQTKPPRVLVALATYNAYFQVFVGYRFTPPKRLREAVEKMDP